MGGQSRIRGAKRTALDGVNFDSRKEARRYAALKLLVAAREIYDLRLQVKFPLMGQNSPILTPTGRQMHYVADFVYRDAQTGIEIVEDAKGHKTETYQIKKAILAAQGVVVMEV